MELETKINEKVQRLQDLNKEMQKISQQIGALQEQGRALHMNAVEVRGAIDALAAVRNEQVEEAEKAKAALILPDKSLVALDGKTVLVKAEEPVNLEALVDAVPGPVIDVVQ